MPGRGLIAFFEDFLSPFALARPRGVAGLRPAFVGRERELELLQATYRRAVEGGEPHLVTIAGVAAP